MNFDTAAALGTLIAFAIGFYATVIGGAIALEFEKITRSDHLVTLYKTTQVFAGCVVLSLVATELLALRDIFEYLIKSELGNMACYASLIASGTIATLFAVIVTRKGMEIFIKAGEGIRRVQRWRDTMQIIS